MERHFTASVYIIEDNQVLLIYHKKLKKWLPPGGHIDPNESPAEAAVREALEETGIEVTLIKQENIWINESNARSFERPYLCLIEEIPAHGNHPYHQHLDMVYLGTPSGGNETQNHHETDGLKWFTLEEVEQLQEEVEIFKETKKVIQTVLRATMSNLG